MGPSPGDTISNLSSEGRWGPLTSRFPTIALSAKITFHELEAGPWDGSDIRVHSMRVRHTCFTVGYRVEAFGSSVVFVPDNELVGGSYSTSRMGWILVAFVSGADLLIHDATYTTQEYLTKEGWGHSTFQQALELAERAGV